MAGTTATFTGCIDTDEPEGITNLRGAKSELIKAQAAVELVEVEMKKALVAEQELINAGLALQNKAAEIDLQLKELDVKLKQLKVEAEEAATAQAKAEAEAAIAKAEAEKIQWEKEQELVIEQYKEKMLLAETATAQAQEAYKQAMEQIEASKYLLTEQEQIRLNGIQAQVAYAKQAMDNAMYGYSTIVIKRVLVSKTTTTTPDESTNAVSSSTIEQYIYEITEDPSKADNGITSGSLKGLQNALAEYPDLVADNNLEAVLDNALKKAENTLQSAQKKADGLKAILDNEYTTLADWEAEVKKLEEEIAAAKVKEQQYNIEKGKLEVANPKLIKDLNSAENKLETAKNNQNSKKNKAQTTAAYSKKVEAESVKTGLNTAAGTTTVEGYDKSTGTFSYAKDVLITKAQSQIDGWVKLIDKATEGVDLENIEWAKPQLATTIAAQKEAEDTYAKDYKAWEDAMAKYDESLKIDLDKSTKAAKDAIAKYNKLSDADRKKEANIDAVATALVTYYEDALAKEAQVTKVTATKGNDTKKISTWLIADANNFKKVVGIELGIIVWGNDGDITTANKISEENIGKLIEVERDSSVKTPLEKWKSASSTVFGDKFNSGNNPRRLPVSEDEVIAMAGGNHEDALNAQNAPYGSLGKMIWAKAETARLQAIIDQVEIFKALKEAFVAQKAVEQAVQDKANAALADAVDKAKKAKDEAQAAYDKIFKEVIDNIEAVKTEYGNNETIKGKIEAEITTYLNNNFTNNLGSLEAIKNFVKEEYMVALDEVTTATADVAKANKNIEKLVAGTYTDTDYITESLVSIQEKINVKQAIYDAAKADYDAASAKLKEVLAVFLK